MLYQAYQAHCDMMGPLRAMASGAISAIGMPLLGLSNTPVLRNLTAVYELIWATGWEDRANDALAGLLGLPELPYLTFDGAARFGTAHWNELSKINTPT